MDQPPAQVPTVINVATQGLVFHMKRTWIQGAAVLLNLLELPFFFQHTMTDATILLEDVQKMKDKGEIAQAYIGLKETNRYKFFLYFVITWGLLWHTLQIVLSQFHPCMSREHS